ncbi:MAG: DUF3368 domain-containing protein [Chitinophagales bacterium]
MPKILSNTSPLIALYNIGQLDILKELYGTVIITEDVKDEFHGAIPDWIIVKPVEDKAYQLNLESVVDRGEASIIALAVEMSTIEHVLILDDLKGRKLARKLGLKITGTLGVVLKAKVKGIIPLVKPILEDLKNDGLWIATKIENEILLIAGEL